MSKSASNKAVYITLAVMLVGSLLLLVALMMYETYKKGYSPRSDVVAPVVVEEVTPNSLYNKISDIRKEYSLPQLGYSVELNKSAQSKCEDMVLNNYYAHVNPETKKNGYEYAAEAIPESVYISENLNKSMMLDTEGFVDSWMGSASHRSAILDDRYDVTGFAVCKDKYETYVVQHLADLEDETAKQQIQYVPTQTNCKTQYYSLLEASYTTCY